jgi:hypothetical protein
MKRFQTVEDYRAERLAIQEKMGTREYIKDERMQARYRELIDLERNRYRRLAEIHNMLVEERAEKR